jgi:hypothetical protein
MAWRYQPTIGSTNSNFWWQLGVALKLRKGGLETPKKNLKAQGMVWECLKINENNSLRTVSVGDEQIWEAKPKG